MNITRTKGGKRVLGNRYVEIVPETKGSPGIYRDVGLSVALKAEQRKMAERKARREAARLGRAENE